MPTVVLGVSGSIAAYKAADLASQLVKAGVDVHPVLTASAAKFVQPATFRALTGNPSPIDIFDECYPGEIAHIHLAKIADVFAIVPATMTTIAKLANGIGDDMLSAAVSATHAPVLIAPGMNTAMWDHSATQHNLSRLRDYGYYFIEPVTGRLACRTEGKGKMADVESIRQAIDDLLNRRQLLAGKKVLITAGPTREAIDPVRYISNRSSGKMGFAIADVASQWGADVTVVTGPVSLPIPSGLHVIKVETAQEMYDASMTKYPDANYVIATAAVSDYRPLNASTQKIKKDKSFRVIELEPTDDLLAEFGRRKTHQTLVGFAAETEDIQQNALAKLSTKNLDWIVANDVTRVGAGFDGDTNIVDIFGKDGDIIRLPQLSKQEVAENLWRLLLKSPIQ